MSLVKFLRAGGLIAVALSLAACGGKASFPINGAVSGLQYNGLVLTSNGMDLSVPALATAFSFPNTLSYGEVYNVTVKTPPAHQNCTTVDQTTGLDTASDTAGRRAAINISLTCYLNTHTIGGSVSGLTTEGLTLTNGTAGGTVIIAAASNGGTYTFTSPVAYNNSYGVTVLTQPDKSLCTVSNAAGVMGDVDITNINVSCVPNS